MVLLESGLAQNEHFLGFFHRTPKSKLTPEQVEELKRKRAEGVKIKDLMESFGLSKASIYRLLAASDLG
ncbi:MAG: Hin recombinase [Methylococcaceae bacterium]|nr:Hin recombinase [Methylococcaceae bacterium]